MSEISDAMHQMGLPERGSDDERRRAARYVAARATDAADCAQILAMLGIEPQEGIQEAT